MVASSSDSLQDVMQLSLRGTMATPKLNVATGDEMAKIFKRPKIFENIYIYDPLR